MAQAAADSSSRTFDFVHLRQVLEALCNKKESDALMEVVFGLLLKAEEVIKAQGVEIQQLRKQLYGRRSEKLSPDQLSLFAQMLDAVIVGNSQDSDNSAGTDPEETEKPDESKKPKKKRKPVERRPLTPTRTVEIRVPAEERGCPRCGKTRCGFDHERTIVIEYTPPKIDVVEHLREKVVCHDCIGDLLKINRRAGGAGLLRSPR